MNAVGNLIWLVCGGFFAALGYFITGFVFCLTAIGVPFGKQHLKLVELTLAPVGKDIVDD